MTKTDSDKWAIAMDTALCEYRVVQVALGAGAFGWLIGIAIVAPFVFWRQRGRVYLRTLLRESWGFFRGVWRGRQKQQYLNARVEQILNPWWSDSYQWYEHISWRQ